MAVTTRLARAEDFPELESRLQESGFSMCDFHQTPCLVAESGGALVGMLPVRLLLEPVAIWNTEPLLVWCEAKMTRRRTMYLLWKAAEQWIASERNRTGVKRYLAISYQEEVKQLFRHAGLTSISSTGFEHLSTDDGAEFFFRQL